jgi:hypothetical protein
MDLYCIVWFDDGPYIEEDDEDYEYLDNLISKVYIGLKEDCIRCIEEYKYDCERWKEKIYKDLKDYLQMDSVRIFKFTPNTFVCQRYDDRININTFLYLDHLNKILTLNSDVISIVVSYL